MKQLSTNYIGNYSALNNEFHDGVLKFNRFFNASHTAWDVTKWLNNEIKIATIISQL